MLDILFGSKNAERVLQYLLSKESGYIREIAQFYEVSPSVIKKQLDKFELANIIVGRNLANIRMYELNKRYPFYEELSALLKKARSTYSDEERMKLIRKKRARPRANNKPLIMRNENEK
ncbi:ArsR family transcriptional regulator [Poseidonibacter ostreae]|jgi:predicted transcriptional regulator|uniref:ArsR family transcriptional regulator n=1 Tax=Poseidonibacter ostreae TaxID=2654171 RepID=A0A6L4WW95_9BACT|nr:ArsR family transcriptional regulator [Poseidonibacter ostreae]KAB7881966.1 ArsR family transcriptional regulator [Poseidonibacter ostreae]KAB7888940.1 ArsR family transcriptional regulator [Poseidonibacter ostreae]KAB7890314.1 ArsR family transcriptional regulator [Poseidonibacter ostreae]